MRYASRLWSAAFVIILLCLTPLLLRAQSLPTASGEGGYTAVGGGGSLFQIDYGRRDLGGLVAYADINPVWRYGIELEARTLRYRAVEDVTEASYMVGPRISLRPGSRLQPYAKFLIGDGRITLPYRYATGSFLAYAPGGGVDYQLTDRIGIRIVDFEYQMWPAFTYGQLCPYGIGAGVNFRLNSVKRFPNGVR
jgi:opacity protein-like surface antigen